MSGERLERETISMRGSLSGNEVSLPAGKQANLLFFKRLRPQKINFKGLKPQNVKTKLGSPASRPEVPTQN